MKEEEISFFRGLVLLEVKNVVHWENHEKISGKL